MDYENDDYSISGPMFPMSTLHRPYPFLSNMAEYAIWLQHEALRANTSPFFGLHKQGWYERRMGWLIKFMDVMGVREENIAKAIESSIRAETPTEKIDKSRVAALFLRSVKTARMGNTGA